jgi:hypothetical protein
MTSMILDDLQHDLPLKQSTLADLYDLVDTLESCKRGQNEIGSFQVPSSSELLYIVKCSIGDK